MSIRFLDKIAYEFDWDEGNSDKNFLKHGISCSECEEVFFNVPVLFFYDKTHSQTEDRFIALGTTGTTLNLFISFTIRKEKLRVISARIQSKKERRIFYEETKQDSKI
ncbi:MAG: BrnT family toxin [Patescibacteria group bacterium]|nr:BrnT family toxin [Patescibacteria group bacterium]